MIDADKDREAERPAGFPPTTARVLPFRPRSSAPAARRGAADEQDPDAGEPDDFRHRMLVNAAGLICAIVLTASGIWLASSIADLRNTQDCVLSGRRNCAPIAAADGLSAASRQH